MKKRIVACPVCKKDSVFGAENAFRPFCSERCHLIDLGDWAEERHRIPDTTPPDLDDAQ